MFEFLSTFWSTLTHILRGVDEFAGAFETTGKATNQAVSDWATELSTERQAKLKAMAADAE